MLLLQAAARGKAGCTTEPEAATPLACLFDRFDALAIDASAIKAARPTALRLPAPAATLPASTSAPAARVPAVAPPRSPLGAARRIPAAAPTTLSTSGPGAARVSFGTTPLVHEYDAAASATGATASPGPCSSRAGRTPYSLAAGPLRARSACVRSSSAHGGGGGIAGVSPPCAPNLGLANVQEEDGQVAAIGVDDADDTGDAARTSRLDARRTGIAEASSGSASFAFAAAATTQGTPERGPSAAAGCSASGAVTPVLLVGGAGMHPAAAVETGKHVGAAADECEQAQRLVFGALPFAGAPGTCAPCGVRGNEQVARRLRMRVCALTTPISCIAPCSANPRAEARAAHACARDIRGCKVGAAPVGACMATRAR